MSNYYGKLLSHYKFNLYNLCIRNMKYSKYIQILRNFPEICNFYVTNMHLHSNMQIYAKKIRPHI